MQIKMIAYQEDVAGMKQNQGYRGVFKAILIQNVQEYQITKKLIAFLSVSILIK